MCGITGYINLKNETVADTNTILQMLRIQRHRGPDDSGIMAFSLLNGESVELDARRPTKINDTFEGILGFNRLSILDLSSNGHQPMVSPDGKVILTLNGEIYNAFDFKKELQDWGYRFRSTTDTEIVLALFLKYGFEKMLSLLNGMFAIAIIDLRSREIFLARDRFGIKPMYYLLNENILAFSSELKSFGFIRNFTFELSEGKLDEYMLFRNNLAETLFRQINSLSPGHYINYSHAGGSIIKRFFDLNIYSRAIRNSGNMEQYKSMLERWLNKSVKSQLMSDVKLGCQLSGGIDSSLITWLANKNCEKGSFEGVSIIFNDLNFSEEKYIDHVSDKLGIVSHKFLLDSDYYLDNLEKATWHYEAPINHPNSIAIYLLSQQAKKHVTVLLSGEGADEVFGGYERFHEVRYPFKTRLLLHEIKKNLRSPVGLFRYLDITNRVVMGTSYMDPIIAGRLKENFTFALAVGNRQSLFRSLSGSLFDRQVKYEMLTYLPDLLIRQDKMSMAHSIENRVPYLDNDIFENSFNIPEEFLFLGNGSKGQVNQKYLLKKIVASKFGDEFAFRNKMGFGIPMRKFFLNSRFTEFVNDKVLNSLRRRGLFSYKEALSLSSRINELSYPELEALWVLVSFEIWASVYLDNRNVNSYS